MERDVEQMIGAAAMIAPALHLVSDILEWIGGGFSSPQLWMNYLGFLAMPALLAGLYAVQRPHVGWSTLLGALLYGAAFVYFAHTTLYALAEHTPDYATLWHQLGPVYTIHGGLMVLGGVLFGAGSLRAAVLPRPAALAFLAGIALNLLFSLAAVPELWQTFGNTLRNLGLMGMGLGILRGSSARAAA